MYLLHTMHFEKHGGEKFKTVSNRRGKSCETHGTQLVCGAPRRVDSNAWAPEKEADLQNRALP